MKGVEEGSVFDGRFTLREKLGGGLYSVVYRAEQDDLGREVVIKFLSLDEEDALVMARFHREARLLSQLTHTNNLRLYEFGYKVSEAPYLVTEFVPGITLHELLARDGALTQARAFTIVKQVLLALREAHSKAIVHRDLKPNNIMVFDTEFERDRVKLLDFGIAKLTGKLLEGEAREDVTHQGKLVGTPRYMAPELLLEEEPTPSSDLYALGLVFYEMLTGERAIEETALMKIVARQLDPDPLLDSKESRFPSALKALLLRATQKDTSKRFLSASQFIDELEGVRVASTVNFDFLDPSDGRSMHDSLSDGWPSMDSMDIFAESESVSAEEAFPAQHSDMKPVVIDEEIAQKEKPDGHSLDELLGIISPDLVNGERAVVRAEGGEVKNHLGHLDTRPAPAAQRDEAPAAPREEAPAVPREEAPAVPREEAPAVPREEAPAAPGTDLPGRETAAAEPQPVPQEDSRSAGEGPSPEAGLSPEESWRSQATDLQGHSPEQPSRRMVWPLLALAAIFLIVSGALLIGGPTDEEEGGQPPPAAKPSEAQVVDAPSEPETLTRPAGGADQQPAAAEPRVADEPPVGGSAEAEAGSGRKVFIRSNPSGAFLFKDGKLVGTTPCSVVVTSGEKWYLQKDGYKPSVLRLNTETKAKLVTLRPAAKKTETTKKKSKFFTF